MVPGNRLSEQHVVTLVLRLVFDRQHELLHGEIVGADGQVESRFVDWQGLCSVAEEWAATCRRAGTDQGSE